MIRKTGNLFVLDTANTSYVIGLMPSGHLEHLYYGAKIKIEDSTEDGACAEEVLKEKKKFPGGNMISYSTEYPELALEDVCLEMSSHGKGDIREALVKVRHGDGSKTSDFRYQNFIISEGKKEIPGLPSSYDEEQKVMQLELVLTDTDGTANEELVLTYSVFEDCDVITKSVSIQNHSEEPVVLEQLFSNQVDFDESEYDFMHFNGAWAREMNLFRQPVHQGKIVNASFTGTSSNRSNPFTMLAARDAGENAGECYGFNLIYSGNHYEACEVGSFGKLRFISGINPEDFAYTLAKEETFYAPEAVLTYSASGFQKLSHNMHQFVREHIVRGTWKKKERPILINSWESMYFDFKEKDLLKLAKKAKEADMELFVLDDGWFGKRNSDTCSLGDWTVNQEKLPGGIAGIAQKINELGLLFGIWVEPEMVNEDSDCYRAHPDWAVQIPGRAHSTGRNQMILDLTREDVRQYVISSMEQVFRSGNISYVKWDMNRIFSDCYSAALENQGEFLHRYVLGLYQVMDHLVKEFPDILFEGCCAGGNRFDLGILCYMPQIWASDNTDAISRLTIQNSYSYGYPASVISAHVSGCPNHQTLRNTSIETRFNVASFGVLGYECKLSDLKKEEFSAIKAQIAFYKQYRKTLQFGDFYRIKTGVDTDYTNGVYQWITVAKDQSEAIGMTAHKLVIPDQCYLKFKTKGLDDDSKYSFVNRALKYNVKEFGDLINTVAPVKVKQDSLLHHVISKVVQIDGEKEAYIAYGSTLNYAGVKLKQSFVGTGFNEEVRHYPDFASRIYVMKKID